ncbi:hypothetical protein HOG47_03105 [archaeon]|jgi:hypothetical protein|nr:hypothetical protein [archaeon]
MKLTKEEKKYLKETGQWISRDECRKKNGKTSTMNTQLEKLKNNNTFLNKNEYDLFKQWKRENGIKEENSKRSELIEQFQFDYKIELENLNNE